MAVAAINALNGTYVMRVRPFNFIININIQIDIMLMDTIFSKNSNVEGYAIFLKSFLFVMKGCDQPLIVRFADPKKPKTGESRYHPSLPQ